MAKWIEDPQSRLEVEKVTEELKLPVWKANYKGKFREFWNECWEKIEDSFLKLKKSNEGKEPVITTKETAFNKPFGVSEDTVLEGNKFTQMTGKDYGGILNIAGQKEAGKAYWDNNTKKLYICKNNNSDISPNVNNYVPFDSNSLLDRLENLISHQKITSTAGMTNISNCTAYITKIGDFVMCSMNIGVITDYAKTTIKSPIQFKEGVFISLEDNNGDLFATNRQPVIGWYNELTQTFEVANINAGFTILMIGRI